MMRPLVFALTTLLVLSCSGKSKGPDPDDDKADGKVVEVAGEVTAQRRGSDEVRTLDPDALVFGDDTVVTGEDSSVKIRLLHNEALLTLGASMTRTLQQTAAWKASRGKGGMFDESSGGQTAAAGRHAERQGADTPATAAEQDNVLKSEEPVSREIDTAEPPGRPMPPTETESKFARIDESKGPPPDDTGKGPPAGDKTAKEDSQKDFKARAVTSSVRFARVQVIAGRPTTASLTALKKRLERAYKNPLRVCHERLLAANPEAGGLVLVELEIDENGHMDEAEATGFDDGIAACVQEQATEWEFEPLVDDSGTPIEVTIHFDVELTPQ